MATPITENERATIVRLKLLGSLKAGDKINTHYLTVMPDTLATKMYRWLYNENRLGTITFCRNTVSQAIFIHNRITCPKLKASIKADLESAKSGIISLQETYLGDIRVHSELLEIVQNIP